ncbi:nucleotidyl transferase AbiEii/AbiGii toxin family protein [Mucilaginibacter sp. X5P1]|uniref:nucleotidyl transferase AbiEii/AbiGii toxin family protein n=1 Tax=Mucilaginibacter sp. X5P1 TaxID=2723088 RepID=UPI00161B8EAD|nr:nucleotidyl transferase AbiEii/AbiGii toxin family protein [Mucilaginibacter sp. X5P1]MBB6141841.1 hypothetical protein [Mucilaginibacter sp. X5P1]
MAGYLHQHPEFRELLRILESETDIQAALIEKDYWIMHVLYGLKSQEYDFELKGGTSLSKGYKIIERFSEDIDIHIKPPEDQKVNENPKNEKPANVAARKNFYDWLAADISIEGIVQVERDTDFDNTKSYSSGGIRLYYGNLIDQVEGIKAGILLEAGFDRVTPNEKLTISSWAYDRAVAQGVEIIDNRAKDIACYNPGYTFVEKLQTIATKFRRERETGNTGVNFMRQYYDVYSLLGREDVQAFIGTPEYLAHKEDRFPKPDLAIPVNKNEAFLLNDAQLRTSYKKRYADTAALYYAGQPDFDQLLARIHQYIDQL